MEGKSSRYNVKSLTDEENAKYKNAFKSIGTDDNHPAKVRVGPAGYIVSKSWMEHLEGIRTMPLRPDDVFVDTYLRSGTTWTQELVWLLANDMNFDKAKSVPLIHRFPFMEWPLIEQEKGPIVGADRTMNPIPETMASIPSPRFIKTHFPLSLLPEGILDTAKVVYVARDPRDVIVSYYHFYKSVRYCAIDASLKEYLEGFVSDLAPWNPYFAHVKEAWQQRHHPNMLFLFYEELSKDLGAVARRVARFLGKQYTDDQYDALLDHLKFDNFRKNTAVNKDYMLVDEGKFIRKGKAGGWRDEFDDEMTELTERWMADNLQGTGLRFQ